jgi:DNA-binding FrmR family transcriptional regulator
MSMREERDDRKKVATRLARVEGQLRGIQALIQGGAQCEEVAIQMTAARRALDRAFYEMLACSVLAHVEDAPQPADIRASTDELTRLLVKFA